MKRGDRRVAAGAVVSAADARPSDTEGDTTR